MDMKLKNVQNRLGENFELNHNMLYPALRRFENMGAITKKIHKQVGKPNRNMYDITETGEEIFSEMLREFPENLRQTIQNFLFVLRYLKNLTMRIEKRF